MSAGTWYIFFIKFIEQPRILGQAKLVEKKFWTSATLNEGIDKLPKNSLFRAIAESGVKASTDGTCLVGMNDWIGMSLTRQLEDANARLQGGVAFLASVGSVCARSSVCSARCGAFCTPLSRSVSPVRRRSTRSPARSVKR